MPNSKKVPLIVLEIICVLAIIYVVYADLSYDVKDYTYTHEYISPAYHIDKIYKSMKGPANTEAIVLNGHEAEELLWITAMKSEIVESQSLKPTSQDFMCHVNLDFVPENRINNFKNFTHGMNRLITLSQGQLTMELPEGFGIPVMSNEPLSIESQVLNLNIKDLNVDVSHKITIDYVKDRDLKRPLKPLFTIGAQGMVLVEGNNPYFEIDHADPTLHGPGCSLGETASDIKYHDKSGSQFTGHWVLKPGQEINSTSTTVFMNVPYDTTVHYAEVHLHPFAESLELRDRTTGQTVFKSYVENFKDRLGLKKVDYFSSRKGVPVYKDHEYELISIYDNTTQENHDAMAHMVLFLKDKQFKKPNKRR